MKARVTVVTGGSTPERGVALAGAGQVVASLRGSGFAVRVVDTCTGLLHGAEADELLGASVGSAPPSTAELEDLAARENLPKLVADGAFDDADVLFLVLHGRQGEGGEVQALFDLAGLRYTGSSALGSAIAMEKGVAKTLLRAAGVPTPDWLTWPAVDPVSSLGLPFIVKPSRVGSTVGLSIVRSEDELDEAVGQALRFDDQVLLERFVSGAELTVGVLGDEALGVGEIVSPGEIFDFQAKYTPGAAREIFPARISERLADSARELALRAHEALHLADYSRIDFRVDAAGELQCLEANTLPGMTETSLLPQSAAVSGYDFDELCHRIVELALAR